LTWMVRTRYWLVPRGSRVFSLSIARGACPTLSISPFLKEQANARCQFH